MWIPLIVIGIIGVILYNLVQSVLSNIWLIIAIVIVIGYMMVDKIGFFKPIKRIFK